MTVTDYKDPQVAAYAIENHPADSRVTMDDSGIVQTLSARMGTGGGNVPMVLMAEERAMVACIENSSGDGIASPLDASYYKGQGLRQGIEREFVLIHESLPNDHGSAVCEQPSGELHRTGCVQQHAPGNKDG